MTATRTLSFNTYKLEPASYEHKQLAEEWTAEDKEHAGIVDPRFWLEQGEDHDSYLVSDKWGPVLFFRVITRQIEPTEWLLGGIAPTIQNGGLRPGFKAAELHMQFMPAYTAVDHKRIAETLKSGCPWLEQILIGAGVEEIYFDSTFPGLVAFTTKHLGFTQEGQRLSKRLAAAAVA